MMRIFTNINELPKFNNAVITVGSYDGVHVGHQKIIGRINELARQKNGESVIITFHPHPRTIVNAKTEVKLLSPLPEKFDLLQKYGVQNVVVVAFDRSFSEQSPQEYIHDFLVNRFRPAVVVIGYNHKFGKNRAGNIGLMRQMGGKHGFEVEEIPKLQLDDWSVSSTKIRQALEMGKVETAAQLLGHAYFVRGLVVKGRQLGGKIGFPTANIHVVAKSKLIPDNGVYAVQVKVRNTLHKGMLNIGLRPTVGGTHKTIEAHVFDFDANIYGEEIQAEFVKLIRREQKFPDLNALIQQLQIDRRLSLEILQQSF